MTVCNAKMPDVHREVKTLLRNPCPLAMKVNLIKEDASAQTGSLWGNPAPQSNILKKLGLLGADGHVSAVQKKAWQALGIAPTDIVSELWIASDDRQHPSLVFLPGGKEMALGDLLALAGQEILGPAHYEQYGPYMSTIMKLVDTHPQPQRGSLSIQVHPPLGHPSRPSKTEMWKGTGRIFLGWNKNMSAADIERSLEDGTLEATLNALELTPDAFVVVPGGIVHAIRYGTFVLEWSRAPGQKEIAKGNIKDATVGLYDRTDGKTPRLGKENVPAALEILSQAGGLKKFQDFYSRPVRLFVDKDENALTRIFDTPDVVVEEGCLATRMRLSLKERGLPLFLEEGSLEIWHAGRRVDSLKRAEARLLPAILEDVELVKTGSSPAVFQVWYPPL